MQTQLLGLPASHFFLTTPPSSRCIAGQSIHRGIGEPVSAVPQEEQEDSEEGSE